VIASHLASRSYVPVIHVNMAGSLMVSLRKLCLFVLEKGGGVRERVIMRSL